MVYLMTPQQQTKKKTSKFKVAVSIIILIVLLLFAWLQESMNAEQVQSPHYVNDLEMLWKWSEEVYADGAMSGAWHFRWDADFEIGGIERLTEGLFIDEQGKVIPKMVRQNGSIIEGNGIVEGSKLIISKVESDEQFERVVILFKLEQNSVARFQQLKAAVNRIASSISAEDTEANLSMKVTGNSKLNDAMNEVLKLTLGQPIEQYEDEGTMSKTIFTTQINQYIWLNDKKMANLQVAVHQHSHSNEQSITMGIPLISGEFGDNNTHNSFD